MRKADKLDELNAFRSGFRHGSDTNMLVSPREAEEILRSLPISVEPSDGMIVCFCNGADDGVKHDTFRYLLTCALPFGSFN